ncbi:uncharacterized protein F5891DRAFT_1188715 [Suillus fuscotomentosus]|uniref:Uncharacterized protein n=1 Tax=Suillus fuscotomentosus TaxID=1912939 RepID=A0AAD4HLC1_9AGAM|nr:uncharacterized protein F5891DRAFT_1188715 [Suillus fuscotomentosus]KAG1900401.1 hypothetical protein F5891DRAFT_1188715 [Suillus fuscotomentosus]
MSRSDTDLLDSLSAELTQRYAQYAPELANFREAIAQNDSKDDIHFLHSFREFVPTTDYEPHKPYIAKFFATQCKKSDVTDLFAPGLPYCLAMSSMTSGKSLKMLPTYWPAPHLLHHPLYLWLPRSEGSTLSPSSLSIGQVLKLYSEGGQSSKTLPVCSLTVGFLRMQKNWDIEHDMDRLNLWDPYAISLLKGFRAFFLLNALFALADRRVTTIRALFANKHFTPNLIRAAELREIGPPGIQGWAVRVWPDFKKFIGITGGSAAASVPKAPQMWKVYYATN